MTPYLNRIWNRCVRCYRLKNQHYDDARRIMLQDIERASVGGQKNFQIEISRRILTHDRKLDYIDFQEQIVTRRFYRGKLAGEVIDYIPQHFTANADGSIRRIYKHRGDSQPQVRALSLRNYFLIHDEELARLLMVNTEESAWIRNIPLTYYPISNEQLRRIKSLEAFHIHLLGSDVMVPKRLQHALSDQELFILFQVVPASHLNALAAMLKRGQGLKNGEANAKSLLVSYYKETLEGTRLSAPTIGSYIDCCRSLGRKVNLRIKSSSRLLQERDSMRKERETDRTPEIKTHPNLILQQTNFPEVQLELINSRGRLQKEAKRMGTCVATYGRRVVDGQCALYHVRYRGRDYTLDLRMNEDGDLFCNQLTGIGNRQATDRLLNMVDKYIQQANPR